VLDPACGSGNFLYLALVELKNIERRVAIEGELLGFPPTFPAIGPEALFGIELNPYAAELARVSVWIGEIQWMRRSGFDIGRKPILKPLVTIQCRNAIKGAIKWTRLSCRSFAANAVRLQLHALAYNLGNFLRTLATPEPMKDWSLTSLKEKLIKIGAKVVSHGCYVAFQMAEVAIPRTLFANILRLITELRPPPLTSTA
jgi:hypothetical protein